MPCWYVFIIILFSLYYGIREVNTRDRRSEFNQKGTSERGKWIFYYFRDFLVQVILTVSSFMALFIANHIFVSLESFKNIAAGTAILLIFLIIWGFTGVTGYLGYVIVAGKFKGK
jgi:hypothetical protein